MTSWRDDPRIPFAIAALLGMIAGVAAKQAVAIQSGLYPRPIGIFADLLVLGVVFLMAMYLHHWKPQLSVEAIALFSAAMAMWGPKGIAALASRWQRGALSAAETLARQMLKPVEPTHRATDETAPVRERSEEHTDENTFAKKSPIRKLRDVVPLKKDIPADEVILLNEADKVDPTNQGGKDD